MTDAPAMDDMRLRRLIDALEDRIFEVEDRIFEVEGAHRVIEILTLDTDRTMGEDPRMRAALVSATDSLEQRIDRLHSHWTELSSAWRALRAGAVSEAVGLVK
jgi:hypothetical protein